MDSKSGTFLVPPIVQNSSCSHPRLTGHSFLSEIGIAETIEAFLILMLSLGAIGANILVIFIINNRRYSAYIQKQPRYLLTSLALNDLAIGLLITPFGLIPSLFHCWPYGEIFCQIQALLRGALSQQSAVILVCMAVDRYMCALHPARYQLHSSKKGCVAILSLTWVINLTVFGCLVLPKGYYFNNTGLMACEPFYYKPSYRILSTCALYFPTTMVLMYCYGSSFHMSRFRLNDLPPSQHPIRQYHHSAQAGGLPTTIPILLATANTITKKERTSNGSTSRSMAAISLSFIVMVTPWTIQEIVAACTNSKLPPFLDFIVTWAALSNSFWNPFLYWLLNSQFRRLSRHLCLSRFCLQSDSPEHKSHCCSINADCDITSLPISSSTRLPGSHMETSLSIGPPLSLQRHHQYHQHHQHHSVRPDIEGLSEKYWGEILERTVSSNSLHSLQKSFSQTAHHPTKQHICHHYQHLHSFQPYHHQQFQQQQQQQQEHKHSHGHSHEHDEELQKIGKRQDLQVITKPIVSESIKLKRINSDLNVKTFGNFDHYCQTKSIGHDDSNEINNDDNKDVISTLRPSLKKISASIANISLSENAPTPSSNDSKIFEHVIFHDINCAKAKAANAAAAAATSSTASSNILSHRRNSGVVTFNNNSQNEIKNIPDI